MIAGVLDRSESPPWRGILVFVLLTFGMSWVPAALLREIWPSEGVPTPLRLLASSGIYALSMGWQPLVALWMVRRWVDRVDLDDFLDGARPRFYAIATITPLALAAVAMALALVFPGAQAEPAASGDRGVSSLLVGALVVVSVAGALALIWVQALAEEVGWRGYFLARLMHQLGPGPGLVLHGAIWGLWYAPVLLLASGDAAAGTRSASFVLTCMFLGTLLGWLRLAAKSVVPTTLANSLLTVTAGLPFILQGEDPGLRAAAYGPHGWLPMGILAILLAARFRDSLRAPVFEVPRRAAVLLVVVPEEPKQNDDPTH